MLPAASPDDQRHAAGLPASVDLRGSAVSVGDQGTVGSCVGWAIGRNMMGWWANKLGQPVTNFAPMYVYSQINGGQDSGSNPVDALKLAVKQGVASWASYPSTQAAAYTWWVQPTAAQRADAAKHKIFSYKTLFSLVRGNAGVSGQNAIKSSLASGVPVAIAFPTRYGFDHLTTGVDNDTTSSSRGGHEVLVVGYNSAGLIVQNQWGTGWGNAGYGVMGWNVVQKDVQEADVMIYVRPAIVGHVDSAKLGGGPGNVAFAGWTYDPSHKGTSLTVKVYENSVSAANYRGSLPANKPRADINKAHGSTGNHGFSGAIAAAAGTHNYVLVGVDGGWTGRIGTATVKVAAPIGTVDRSGSVGNGKVKFVGWAFDPDMKATSIRVDVFEGAPTAKNYRGRVNATTSRPDVNRVYSLTGKHGFSGSINATSGTHTYQLWATAGGARTLIGTQKVIVKAPVGHVDTAASIGGGKVKITGWAFDPTISSGSIAVDVVEGTKTVAHVPARNARADVDRVYKIKGSHGFSTSVTAKVGRHTYKIYAAAGTNRRLIGTKTVTVAATKGAVSSAAPIAGHRVKVLGWAYDPGNTKASIRVDVYDRGQSARRGTVKANAHRHDINVTHHIAGNHGVSAWFVGTPGRHTYQFYAINGSLKTLIGTYNVTVK